MIVKSQQNRIELVTRPDIRQVSTIEEALKQYFSGEKLIDDNMYMCERCEIKVSATKRYTQFTL